MIRVCFTIGTWQLVTLAAALQQVSDDNKASSIAAEYEDYLVVYETGGVPDTFKQTLQEMAEAIWPWKRIVWAYDLLTAKRRIGQLRFDFLRRTLRDRVGVSPDQVEEVWVCWLTRPAEKLVFATYPFARIQIFEDGLISYIPISLATDLDEPVDLPKGIGWFRRQVRVLLDAWRPVRRYRRSRDKLDPRHLDRVKSAYLQLTPNAPPPEVLAHIPRRFVEYGLLQKALDRVKPLVSGKTLENTAEDAASPDRLLLLGQALSRNGIMPRDEELRIYMDITETLLAKGYRVLWKEHPRISEPFFADLSAHVNTRYPGAEDRLQELFIPHAFPVELVADRLGLAGCVAGTSVALFYLRRLYAIPCYTFAEALLPRMQGADVFMNDMIRREVPPLTALPSVESGSHAPKAVAI